MKGGRSWHAIGTSLYFGYPVAAMCFTLVVGIHGFRQEALSVPVLPVIFSTVYRGGSLAALVAVIAVALASGALLQNDVGRPSEGIRQIARVVAVSTQFLSPLLISIGWIVVLGKTPLAFSVAGMILGLVSLAIPPAYVLIDLYAVRRITRFMETAAALGAGPLFRLVLAVRLAAPAIVGALLVTFAWTYSDLVIISLVGSGNQFFPGPFVSYLIRQSTMPHVAVLATIPSVAVALVTATMALRAGRTES